ncbi:hypothetical protein D3875_19985 [Deinococcus cavernae]|uniref:YwiC-like family protein n=1 Tax=Deinococcus cavernae TaxID=2320857 RepID=A0A418VBT6_9DEIO|nr:YwiC-like family protein [Deinococcus cavernae]RJF73486.1 hypothetical protein D3875_19985 [Deinococcus cavernae]
MPAKAAALTVNDSHRIAPHPQTQRPKRRRLPVEWLPQQHGAWAMLFLPFIVGVVLRAQEGHFNVFALPLLLLWLVGYFAFYDLSMWLKARNKTRYVRPLQVYGGLSAVLAAVVLWLEPTLIQWGIVYAPLLGAGLWQAWKKDETALLGRVTTVIAACLICAVTFSDGLFQFVQGLPTDPAFQRAASATALLTLYFIGTIFYVKTMIRERGEKGFLAYSIGYHAAITLLSVWAALTQGLSWLVPAFLFCTTLRACALPMIGPMRKKTITPKQVGITEFFFVLMLLFLLVR